MASVALLTVVGCLDNASALALFDSHATGNLELLGALARVVLLLFLLRLLLCVVHAAGLFVDIWDRSLELALRGSSGRVLTRKLSFSVLSVSVGALVNNVRELFSGQLNFFTKLVQFRSLAVLEERVTEAIVTVTAIVTATIATITTIVASSTFFDWVAVSIITEWAVTIFFALVKGAVGSSLSSSLGFIIRLKFESRCNFSLLTVRFFVRTVIRFRVLSRNDSRVGDLINFLKGVGNYCRRIILLLKLGECESLQGRGLSEGEEGGKDNLVGSHF